MTRFLTNPPLWLHGVIFNVIWLLFVVFYQPIAATALTLTWLFTVASNNSQGQLLIGIWLIGIIADFILVYSNFFKFQGSYFEPIWLAILWIAFAHFASILITKINLTPFWWGLLFGIGGPVTYYIAELNQALIIQWSWWPLTVVFVLFWLFFIPTIMKITEALSGTNTDIEKV